MNSWLPLGLGDLIGEVLLAHSVQQFPERPCEEVAQALAAFQVDESNALFELRQCKGKLLGVSLLGRDAFGAEDDVAPVER